MTVELFKSSMNLFCTLFVKMADYYQGCILQPFILSVWLNFARSYGKIAPLSLISHCHFLCMKQKAKHPRCGTKHSALKKMGPQKCTMDLLH